MPSEKVLSEKKKIVEELTDKLKSQSGVFVNYSGITVNEDTGMRVKMREANVDYSVIKNTLMRFAIKNVGFEELESILVGTTSLAVSNDDPIAPARIIKEYADSLPNYFEIKGGFMDGRVLSISEVNALASIPALPVLQAQLLGTMLAPIATLAVVLKAIAEKGGAPVDAHLEEPTPVVETTVEAAAEASVEKPAAVETAPEAPVETPVEESAAVEAAPEAPVETPAEEPAAEEAAPEAPIEESAAAELEPEAPAEVPAEEPAPEEPPAPKKTASKAKPKAEAPADGDATAETPAPKKTASKAKPKTEKTAEEQPAADGTADALAEAPVKKPAAKKTTSKPKAKAAEEASPEETAPDTADE